MTQTNLTVLLVGSGGREHALAWKLSHSPRLRRLLIAPGNPGTAGLGTNLMVSEQDHAGILRVCQENAVDLVVIGPEIPLADGLADRLMNAGVKVFGPSAAAARIEASKAFARDFMQKYNIPSPRYGVFDDPVQALAYLQTVGFPVVIKASGLAAGKGVILPETMDEATAAMTQMLDGQAFGEAGRRVVIEERLSGPEVSLLAFTDGITVSPMPPAQDHKRLRDGDAGPNTGGMGAYAPALILDANGVKEAVRTVLQPAVDGLRQEGCPFVGVLYAGLMLTPDGMKVLEYNCRFGDPETQALVPLLQSDLLEIMLACTEQRLGQMQVAWSDASAACVVLAAAGYPDHAESGAIVRLPEGPLTQAALFHAGTRSEGGYLVTARGRVFGATGWGASIEEALEQAYALADDVQFAGKQLRRDIAWQVRRPAAQDAYAASGVNIDAGNRAVALMKDSVRSTYDRRVLAGIGAFGGLFDAADLKQMAGPVLVASTDGVGTKVKLATRAGRYRSIGMDIVNHCINDILVQGARPLFFLDYFATAKLQPEVTAEIVSGIADACREAGCALLGGETAEMPGVYADGEFDLAGTIVGLVDRQNVLPRADLQVGDLLIGLRSSGPHTNGYSLLRRVFDAVPLETVYPEIGVSLADALLAPHRSYLPLLTSLLSHPDQPVKALAHLTGGGFIENIPRILPDGLQAVVRRGSWPVPELYRKTQQLGNIADEEMYRVFNMGIGMVIVAAPEMLEVIQKGVGETCWVVGELREGRKEVVLA